MASNVNKKLKQVNPDNNLPQFYLINYQIGKPLETKNAGASTGI